MSADFKENLYNKNVFRKALKGSKVGPTTYIHTTNGTQTLAAADASHDRNVLIVIECKETFADGDGTQPTFEFGETSTLTKFSVTGLLTGAKKGDKFVLTGKLSSTKALLCTAATGTGTTEKGAIEVHVAIFPATI